MKTKRLVGMAMFAAIVAVLQLAASFIPIKEPNISLTLIPIVIGAAVYGKKCGAFLGFVFGLVTLCDPTAKAFMGINLIATVLMLLLKAIAAGWTAGMIFEVLFKRTKNIYLAGISAAVVCPVVNTAIFCVGMLTIFKSTLTEAANGANIIYFLLIAYIGINFVIELGLNIILSPAVIRIIENGRKNLKA